ncbi:MAG: hypothetical protein ACTTJ9_10960 [Segatella oris]|uniref:hypothetical protein n=1 Tax=Segatella oris TaxID=28135 RepID=UPI003FA1B02D
MKDTFSKADTMAVKGVAILFMLFAHLFNRSQLIDLSTPLVYVGEQPLVYLLIFLVLLCISYLVAVVIDRLNAFLQRYLIV